MYRHEPSCAFVNGTDATNVRIQRDTDRLRSAASASAVRGTERRRTNNQQGSIVPSSNQESDARLLARGANRSPLEEFAPNVAEHPAPSRRYTPSGSGEATSSRNFQGYSFNNADIRGRSTSRGGDIFVNQVGEEQEFEIHRERRRPRIQTEVTYQVCHQL